MAQILHRLRSLGVSSGKQPSTGDSYPPVPDAFESVRSFLEDLQELMSQLCKGDTQNRDRNVRRIQSTPCLLMGGATRDEMELFQEGKC